MVWDAAGNDVVGTPVVTAGASQSDTLGLSNFVYALTSRGGAPVGEYDVTVGATTNSAGGELLKWAGWIEIQYSTGHSTAPRLRGHPTYFE